MTAAVEVFEWRHPQLGYVLEAVCRIHADELHRAVRFLGIGCGARNVRGPAPCWRCEHAVGRPRAWLVGRPTSTLLEDGTP